MTVEQGIKIQQEHLQQWETVIPICSLAASPFSSIDFRNLYAPISFERA